jgi:hypothetical protein
MGDCYPGGSFNVTNASFDGSHGCLSPLGSDGKCASAGIPVLIVASRDSSGYDDILG